MNGKINLDLISLKFIYNKNKSYILSTVIILFSVLLFFQFVIPEYNTLQDAQKEAAKLIQRRELLKANLNVLTNTKDDELNSQLNILTAALPSNKDVIKILNSIYATAQKTGVSLGSFSFVIGDIYKSEKNDSLPVIKVSVPINAGVIAVNSFIETMSNTIPLAQVDSFKMGDESSTVDLSFYYKPLETLTYRQDDQISPMSQKGLVLINQLSNFQDASLASSSSSLQIQVPVVATSSAAQ